MLIPELTLTAFAAAGIAASPHCALMCGPLQALQLRASPAGRLPRDLLLLQAGRIAGYALLGALAGAGGLLLLRRLPDAALGLPLQALAALVLLGLGLRQLARPQPAGCCVPRSAVREATPSPRRLFGRGLALAALPCAALYAMLFVAMLSREPLFAALLMAAFGLGTVPLAGGSGALLRRAGLSSGRLRRCAAALLVLAGALTAALAIAGPAAAPFTLCSLDF